MGRYRKIDPRFWKDEKIRELNLPEKIIALYAFTGQSNRIGLFNFSPGAAAEDLGTLPETFREGFEKVCGKLNFGWDDKARVLFLPTWWKYNTPENPNVLKACLQDLHEIPQTPLLVRFSENLRYLPETFHQTFREGLPQPSPQRMAHQEQEQEQDKEEKIGAKAPGLPFDKGTGHAKTEPSRQIPKSRSKERSVGHTRGDAKGIPADLLPQVEEVTAKINQLCGVKFQANSEGTTSEIVRNLREGKTTGDMILIAEFKWREWEGTDMVHNFNPTTLYRKKHFDTYLAQAKATNGAGNGSPPAFTELSDGYLELTANRVRISRVEYEKRWGETSSGGAHV